MKQTFLSLLLFCVSAAPQGQPPRPRILGLASVHFYATNIAAARPFYQQVMHPEGACLWCEQPPTSPFGIPLSSGQVVTLSAPSRVLPPNLLYEIVFATDSLKAMRTYLLSNKVPIETAAKNEHVGKDRDARFSLDDPLSGVQLSQPRGFCSGEELAVTDPEGHRVSFMELSKSPGALSANFADMRIIHAGFVVHDRAAMDRFYQDILGFHVYWQGGRRDGETDWVDMQVPDGTDWLEYMLNVPLNASHKTLGVMNHIALGVPEIHAARNELIRNGWKGTEEPKIGRDGKWQLNLYDPDGTRIELMEFTPVREPCCSSYTGSHPGPNP